MKHLLLPLLLGASVLAPALAATPAPQPQSLALVAAAAVPRWGKFEASWTLPAQTGNPFDPRDNDIQVAFAGPHGLRAVVPAFWDGDCWRVRYAPPQIGRYTLHILRGGLPAHALGLSAGAFRCAAGTDAGFVHASLKPVPRLVFGNGRPFYPLGMNIAWTGGDEPAYPALLHAMGGNGLNWARIWMNHWDGKNLDWAQNSARTPARGLLLPDVARKWDAIFDSAAQSGVYVQMTLQHHGQYTALVDPNWPGNPWNTANGGFLHAPQDFFTDPEARRLTRAKYRYIVARWGYSTHLLSFELFNEVQNIREAQPHFAAVVAWHREMAAFIRALDVNHHLVTTSNSEPATPLAQIGLDYSQIHAYPPDMVSYFAALHPSGPLPTFVGEWGGDPHAPLDDQRAFLHDGLWAGMMTPTAGAAQFWYGDAVVRNAWWPELRSAASFLQTFHVPNIASKRALDTSVRTPGAQADLSFAPPGGWETTTNSAVITLAPDGSAPRLSGVSSYVQGSNHRDMMPRPLVFLLHCARPAEFRLDLGTVAAAGAHPALSLDGHAGGECDLPASAKDHAAGQSLSIRVPPGAHRVGVFNSGPDWFVISRVVVTGYVPAAEAFARGTNHSAVFWARRRPGGSAAAGSVLVTFPALVSGAYQVRLWDTGAARALPPLRATATAAGLRIRLPLFRRDIAGVAVRL